jgi:hypothetical protein
MFDKNQKPVGLLDFQFSLTRPQNSLALAFGPVGFREDCNHPSLLKGPERRA